MKSKGKTLIKVVMKRKRKSGRKGKGEGRCRRRVQKENLQREKRSKNWRESMIISIAGTHP